MSQLEHSLFYSDEVVSFEHIMQWEENNLTEEQRRKAADYLTLKKAIEEKWSSEDKKSFLRVKKLLKTHSNSADSVERVKA